MGISQKDIKLLWRRAGSRCFFPSCKIKLCQDSKYASNSFPSGEQPHIVVKSEDGPGGKSIQILSYFVP